MQLNSFPFSDGIPLVEKKHAQHADGAVTEVQSTPFCFDSLQQNLWRSIQIELFPHTTIPSCKEESGSGGCSELSPVRITLPPPPVSQGRDESPQPPPYPSPEVLASLSLALLRDGVVILSDPTLANCSVTECAVSTDPSCVGPPELTPSLCSRLAHPTLMALLDGVLGQQVLRLDASCGRHPGCTDCSCVDRNSGALEGVVVPAGLFTDDLPIRALPWELQEVLLQRESETETETGVEVEEGGVWVRGCEMGKANFPLHSPLDDVVDAVWANATASTTSAGQENTEADEKQPYMQFVTGSHRMPGHYQPAPSSTDEVLHWRGRLGEVCVFLGSTLYRHLPTSHTSSVSGHPSAYNRPLLKASYHTAYLRQRADLYLQYPPSAAIHLPPYMQRLLGYGMHAPVLNKLYCGAGPFSILPAYEGYGSGTRPIDWAGAAVELPGAKEYAAFCGWTLPEPHTSIGMGIVGKSDALLLPPPPITAATQRSQLSTESLALALDNIGSYMRQLPPQHQGLVTVDTTRHSNDHAYGLALAAMVRDGCVVLGKAVTKDTCEECMRQLRPYYEDVKGSAVGSLAARSCAAWPLLAHPQVLQLCDAVLGKQRLLKTEKELQAVLARQYPARRRAEQQHQQQHQQAGKPDCYSPLSAVPQCFPYQLHLNVTIPKQSGSVEQVLHRDGDLSLLDFAALGAVDHAVSCIWALDGDFTEQRGTTRVVLGSHDWPYARQISPQESIPAEMEQGSVFLYTGRTVHGAGNNQTTSPRVALNVAYNSASLKQEENQFAAVPPSIAQTLPLELQRLLGYNTSTSTTCSTTTF